MLVSEAFSLLYEKVTQHSELMRAVLEDDFRLEEQIPLVSLDILTKILKSQASDGSWNSTCELTANAILAISALARLPWIRGLRIETLAASLSTAKAYLDFHKSEWSQGRYLWVEKVTYASDLLSEAYCVAASVTSALTTEDGEPAEELAQQMDAFYLSSKVLQAMWRSTQLFSRTPLFADMDADMMRIAACQAGYAAGRLRRQRLETFPRKGMSEDKYLMVIPLTWTACNIRLAGRTSKYVESEMIILSMLMFQADEFMEHAVGSFERETEAIRSIIRQLCEISSAESGNVNVDFDLDLAPQKATELINTIREPLARFVKHIMHHPSVTRAPYIIQRRLSIELNTFLQAHITQLEDSRSLERERATPKRTYYNWVRSTSADHTSCPVAFVFYTCLLNSNILEGGQAAFVAEDLCRHLATMCRVYNDYGSLKRDRAENNLSSADFPEIWRQDESVVKHVLMWIAEYERRGLNMALAELRRVRGEDDPVLKALELFIDVTDLYGQIYVQQDIASRMK